MTALAEFILWIALALCVVVFVAKCTTDSNKETITLVKDEWACTKNHQKKVMTMVGKIPVVQSHTVCDVYARAE